MHPEVPVVNSHLLPEPFLKGDPFKILKEKNHDFEGVLKMLPPPYKMAFAERVLISFTAMITDRRLEFVPDYNDITKLAEVVKAVQRTGGSVDTHAINNPRAIRGESIVRAYSWLRYAFDDRAWEVCNLALAVGAATVLGVDGQQLERSRDALRTRPKEHLYLEAPHFEEPLIERVDEEELEIPDIMHNVLRVVGPRLMRGFPVPFMTWRERLATDARCTDPTLSFMPAEAVAIIKGGPPDEPMGDFSTRGQSAIRAMQAQRRNPQQGMALAWSLLALLMIYPEEAEPEYNTQAWFRFEQTLVAWILFLEVQGADRLVTYTDAWPMPEELRNESPYSLYARRETPSERVLNTFRRIKALPAVIGSGRFPAYLEARIEELKSERFNSEDPSFFSRQAALRVLEGATTDILYTSKSSWVTRVEPPPRTLIADVGLDDTKKEVVEYFVNEAAEFEMPELAEPEIPARPEIMGLGEAPREPLVGSSFSSLSEHENYHPLKRDFEGDQAERIIKKARKVAQKKLKRLSGAPDEEKSEPQMETVVIDYSSASRLLEQSNGDTFASASSSVSPRKIAGSGDRSDIIDLTRGDSPRAISPVREDENQRRPRSILHASDEDLDDFDQIERQSQSQSQNQRQSSSSDSSSLEPPGDTRERSRPGDAKNQGDPSYVFPVDFGSDTDSSSELDTDDFMDAWGPDGSPRRDSDAQSDPSSELDTDEYMGRF